MCMCGAVIRLTANYHTLNKGLGLDNIVYMYVYMYKMAEVRGTGKEELSKETLQ